MLLSLDFRETPAPYEGRTLMAYLPHLTPTRLALNLW